jgi:MoxR-like ATPase
MGKVIVGQERMIDGILIGLLTDGHILIEGVPGLAKTLTIRTLADIIALKFQRIQFTPDLLPADLIGTLIYDQRTGEFTPRKGPIFANLILADEINRAPAKVQSALLEAMQERQVTIGDTTYTLPKPFLVMATQNPIEQEGTYPLPEAQIDRFMLKIVINYPTPEQEFEIMNRMGSREIPKPAQVITPESLLEAQKVLDTIYVDEKIKDYIVRIITATREPRRIGLDRLQGFIEWGASPRASIYLLRSAKARAFLSRRGYVVPEDVKITAGDVLRHRIILSFEAEAEEVKSDQVIREILDHVEVP